MSIERPYWAIVLPDDTEFMLGPQNGITLLTVTGAGMPPADNIMTGYALLDGASWQRVKVQPRVVQLVMGIAGAGQRSNYYACRRALLDAVSPHRAILPLELRYYGYDGLRTLNCYYDSGMELDAEEAGQERFVLRLLATDPFFYGEDDSDTLDDADSISLAAIGSELAGEWDDVGGGVGAAVIIYELVMGSDGRVYACGAFTTAGGAPANYIAAWDQEAASWGTLGAANGMNNLVQHGVMGPGGKLYIGGWFTDVNGGVGGTYNHVAAYDIATDTFAALGAGTDNYVYAIEVGLDGEIYAGGTFLNAGGGAANYIAMWDGAAWNALGAGMNARVWALEVGPDGLLYAGGSFTTAGGNPANYVAVWDGTAWAALGSGMDDTVYALKFGPDGLLYAGGAFTTADGNSARRVAVWNGTTWSALGEGVDDEVRVIKGLADGSILVGGYFNGGGADQALLGVALWNGYSWVTALANIVNVAGAPARYVLGAEEASDGRIYIAGQFTATILVSERTIIENTGSARAYPVITIECPDQAGDPVPYLLGIHNETTGRRLWFNYRLLEGETLTIDCRPQTAGVTSDWRGSAVGNNPLPGSQLSLFGLAPGHNAITVFVWDEANGPGSTTVTISWAETWMGID